MRSPIRLPIHLCVAFGKYLMCAGDICMQYDVMTHMSVSFNENNTVFKFVRLQLKYAMARFRKLKNNNTTQVDWRHYSVPDIFSITVWAIANREINQKCCHSIILKIMWLLSSYRKAFRPHIIHDWYVLSTLAAMEYVLYYIDVWGYVRYCLECMISQCVHSAISREWISIPLSLIWNAVYV